MPSLSDLPSEVLTNIFAALPLQERHRSIPLVCRRWEQLCKSAPQLLCCISFSVSGGPEGMVRLMAFSAWLLRHGPGQVQRLSLEASIPEDTPSHLRQDLEATVLAAISACGAGGSLRALRLRGLLGQPSIWVHAMRGLQQLDLARDRFRDDFTLMLALGSAPSDLPGLEQLSLSGIQLSAVNPLLAPASLTKLHLNFDGHPEHPPLPDQVSTLTRLHTLSLKFAGPDLSALASLTSLRRLALLHCAWWPSCIGELPLEALALEDGNDFLHDEHAAAAAVAAALRSAPLAHLVLSEVPLGAGPPPELAATRGLRTFGWISAARDSEALVLGPWARSLERLAVRAEAAAGFVGALPSEAPRLAVLGLHCAGDVDSASQVLSRLPGLSPALPALRRVVLAGSAPLMGDLAPALLAAQRAAPHVCIDCIAVPINTPNATWDTLLAAVCGGPGYEPCSAEALLAAA